jgi:Plasmid pRiA4b ORF-3-like protein
LLAAPCPCGRVETIPSAYTHAFPPTPFVVMANQEQAATDLPNYLLQTELQNITNPCIVRTLSVPASATFHTLHCALQVAFGWGNCHLHSFEVLAAPRAPNARKVPRVLLKIDPSPNQYDDVFDPMPQNTKKLRLRDVYENAIYKDSAIEYWYDFGDDWMHSISLIGRALASTRQIVCLSGEGSPAEEDCGGPGGW